MSNAKGRQAGTHRRFLCALIWCIAMAKAGLPKASSLWRPMLYESSDYLEAYALVDKFVRGVTRWKRQLRDGEPLKKSRTELDSCYPKCKTELIPSS
jgi:hypothetical protein